MGMMGERVSRLPEGRFRDLVSKVALKRDGTSYRPEEVKEIYQRANSGAATPEEMDLVRTINSQLDAPGQALRQGITVGHESARIAPEFFKSLGIEGGDRIALLGASQKGKPFVPPGPGDVEPSASQLAQPAPSPKNPPAAAAEGTPAAPPAPLYEHGLQRTIDELTAAKPELEAKAESGELKAETPKPLATVADVLGAKMDVLNQMQAQLEAAEQAQKISPPAGGRPADERAAVAQPVAAGTTETAPAAGAKPSASELVPPGAATGTAAAGALPPAAAQPVRAGFAQRAAKMPAAELARRTDALREFIRLKREQGEAIPTESLDNLGVLYHEALRRGLTPASEDMDAFLRQIAAPSGEKPARVAAELVPALRTKEGTVITGTRGQTHQDIYDAQPGTEGLLLRTEEPEHGFLRGDDFLSRAQAAELVGEPQPLQSERLRELQQLTPGREGAKVNAAAPGTITAGTGARPSQAQTGAPPAGNGGTIAADRGANPRRRAAKLSPKSPGLTEADGLLFTLAGEGIKLPAFIPDGIVVAQYRRLRNKWQNGRGFLSPKEKAQWHRIRALFPQNYEDLFGRDGETMRRAYEAAKSAGVAGELFTRVKRDDGRGFDLDAKLDQIEAATGRRYSAVELWGEIERLAGVHRGGGAAAVKEDTQLDQAGEQYEAFQRDLNQPPTADQRTLKAELLPDGARFTMNGAKLRVTDVNVDADGNVTSVELDDGNKYGTQTVDGETVLVLDKGSLTEPGQPGRDRKSVV